MHLPIEKTWDGLAVGPDERAEVRVGRAGRDWTIEVHAPFHDDPPPPQAAGSCPGLWTYEVVECFLVAENRHYLEVELGPHGHYLLLSLEGARNIVRRGMPASYRAEIDRRGRRWHGSITIDGDLVPLPVTHVNAFALHGLAPLRRHLCFWPLGGGRPDFHRIERYPSFMAPTVAAAGAAAPGD